MDIGVLLWFLAVFTAGLAAGQMLGEFLLLGPFQSWFFETGNSEMFKKSYVQFRKTRAAARVFNAVYILAILIALAYVAVLLFTGKFSLLPLIALILQLLFLAVFYGSGFSKLEHQVFGGNLPKELADKFRRMNVPSLGIYSLLWAASFFILLIVRL